MPLTTTRSTCAGQQKTIDELIANTTQAGVAYGGQQHGKSAGSRFPAAAYHGLADGFNRDSAGEVFSWSAAPISLPPAPHRNSPVYSFWEFHLHMVVSLAATRPPRFRTGERRRELTLRILAGEPVTSIPVVKESRNPSFIFRLYRAPEIRHIGDHTASRFNSHHKVHFDARAVQIHLLAGNGAYRHPHHCHLPDQFQPHQTPVRRDSPEKKRGTSAGNFQGRRYCLFHHH